MKAWADLRNEFELEVFRRGVTKMARAIPAGRTTVYRLLKGQVKRPTKAIRAGIERIVKEERTS